jgi:hypothetical protein
MSSWPGAPRRAWGDAGCQQLSVSQPVAEHFTSSARSIDVGPWFATIRRVAEVNHPYGEHFTDLSGFLPFSTARTSSFICTDRRHTVVTSGAAAGCSALVAALLLN